MDELLGAGAMTGRSCCSYGGRSACLFVVPGLSIAARVLFVYLVLIAFFAFGNRTVCMSVEASHQVHDYEQVLDGKVLGSQRQQLHLQAQEAVVFDHRKAKVVDHSSPKTTTVLMQDNCRRLSSRSSYENSRESAAGIVVELVHRDAPNSPFRNSGMLSTREDLHREMLKRDTARVQTLATRVSSAWNSTLKPSTRKSGNGSSTLQSPVQSGMNVGIGEYFMTIQMGTPPRNVLATVDTGSDMFWLQCQPCEDCYNQIGPIFNPARSASFKMLPCTSPVCDELSYFLCSSKTTSRVCLYTVTYGDGSVSQGDLSEETLILKSASTDKPYYVKGFAFGCGHVNKGLFAGSAGILGLGRGKLSLPSQLLMHAAVATNRFSYCLTDRFNNPDASSYIRFGAEAGAIASSNSRKQQQQLEYISMLKNPQMPVFYYVKLTGVTVGTKSELKFPPSFYEIEGNGNGGVIMDSGTSITRLAEPAYSHFRDTFRTATAHLTRVESEYSLFDTCYSLAHNQSQLLATIPIVTLFFDDKVSMPLSIDNTILAIDSKGTFCLAFATGGGPGNVSILGNVQQQNFEVEYDLTNNRIGFAPTDCAHQD